MHLILEPIAVLLTFVLLFFVIPALAMELFSVIFPKTYKKIRPILFKRGD